MAYVYRHIRLDKNIPFYIGIGSDSDYKYARAYDNGDRRKCSKIWKFIAAKTKYDVEIVIDNISWEFACEKEKEFIKLYGRIDNKTGILANMTNGGEGVLGLIQSEEHKKKTGDLRRGKPQTAEANLKRSITQTGSKRGPETGAKISKANKGKTISQEQRDKISKTLSGRKIPIEVIKKIINTRKSRVYPKRSFKHSEDAKIKISNAHKGKPRLYLRGRVQDKAESLMRSEACKTKKAVLQYSIDNTLICEYESQREAALKTGFKKEAIGRACRGMRGYRNNIHNGFIWHHKNNI